MSAQDVVGRIENFDLSLFQIETQTSPNDQQSFLAVQNAMGRAKDRYVYLECGSHLGGSLLPHILDPRCRLAYSVDKRPATLADDRGIPVSYPDNQTRRMIDLLAAHAPAESMRKLVTFDVDAGELAATQIAEQPDLVLIDAEHTVRAVFRDFLNLSRRCGPSTVYAFHDANLIFGGLQNIETYLQHSAIPFDSYILRDSVFVLATNDARDVIRYVGQKLGGNKEAYWRAAQTALMTAHYEILDDARQASSSRQAGVSVTGRT